MARQKSDELTHKPGDRCPRQGFRGSGGWIALHSCGVGSQVSLRPGKSR